jgi:hypothetical protein
LTFAVTVALSLGESKAKQINIPLNTNRRRQKAGRREEKRK